MSQFYFFLFSQKKTKKWNKGRNLKQKILFRQLTSRHGSWYMSSTYLYLIFLFVVLFVVHLLLSSLIFFFSFTILFSYIFKYHLFSFYISQLKIRKQEMMLHKINFNVFEYFVFFFLKRKKVQTKDRLEF